MRKRRGTKVWLVTWVWMNDSSAVTDKVVAILKPRLTPEKVSYIVELMYSITTSNLDEMAAYARHPEENPYCSKYESGYISCGHHPWLEARKVSDLFIETDENTLIETIKWNELPIYKIINNEVKQIRGPIPCEFKRHVIGPTVNISSNKNKTVP